MLCVVTGVVTVVILITIIISPAPKQTWSQAARGSVPCSADSSHVMLSSHLMSLCRHFLLCKTQLIRVLSRGVVVKITWLLNPWSQASRWWALPARMGAGCGGGGGLQWFLLDICWRSWNCMGLVHGLLTMLTVDHKHCEHKKNFFVSVQKPFAIMWDLFFKHRREFSPSFFSSFLNYIFS